LLRIGGVSRSGALGSAALLLLLTALVALASHPAVSQNPCSLEVLSEVVRTLEELSSRFVDVGGAVEYLDQLLKACSRGDVGGASSIYSKLAETLGHLREYSRTRFWEVMAYRATYTAALVLVPILTYVLLPRAYLYLWYLARRSWTVVRRR
jgi:hypothetical protein